MTQVRIFIEPLDGKVAAYEVARVANDARVVASVVGGLRGAFNVASYSVPVAPRGVQRPQLSIAGGGR